MQLCGDCSTFPYARQSTRDGGTKSPAWMPTTWPTSNAYAGSVTSPLRIANGIIAHGEPQEMPIVRGQQLARCPVVSLPSAPNNQQRGRDPRQEMSQSACMRSADLRTVAVPDATADASRHDRSQHA